MTSPRDKLAIQAGFLFQQKGYHGVGIAEILKQTQLPKGSLYHHFPQGKADLALAAAQIASSEMLRLIDDAFGSASSFMDGYTTLCYKLAKYVDLRGGHIGCPVSSTLFEGPENDAFAIALDRIFAQWLTAIDRHAQRFGAAPEKAERQAKLVFFSIQGGWTLARSKRSSDPLRDLPRIVKDALA